MKKVFIVILFLVIFLNVFSYIYISGNNVIKPNDRLNIYGYGREQVLMQVYTINNPDNVIIRNQDPRNEEKRFIFQRILRRNQETNDIRSEIILRDVGLYYISFHDESGNIISYEQILVTNLEMISAYDGDLLVLKFYNNQTLEEVFVDRMIVEDVNNNTFVYRNIKEIQLEDINLNRVIIQKNNNYAFSRSFYVYKTYKNKPLQFISDKPIYKPDQFVNFRINSFSMKDNYYAFNNDDDIRIVIYDPARNVMKDEIVSTKETGGYNGQFYLSDSAPIGYYSVELQNVNSDEGTFYYGFTVQDYVKPEYTVDITSDKQKYSSGDIIHYSIDINYLNQTPVNKAKVSYYVYYTPFYEYRYSRGNLVNRGIGFTNENGELKIHIKTDENHHGYYFLEIISVDESQRQLEYDYFVNVYKGNYLFNTERRYYYFPEDFEFSIKGSIEDIDGNLIDKGEIKASLFIDGEIIKETVFDFSDGLFEYVNNIKDEGYYQLRLEYKDTISTINISIGQYYDRIKVIDLKIDNDKVILELEAYEELNGLIFLAGENIYDFVSYVHGRNIYEFSIPKNIIEKSLFINGIFIGKNTTSYIFERIRLFEEDDFIYDFDIITDKLLYEPGEKVELKIKAERDGVFTLSVIDKAIYELISREPNLIDDVYPEPYSSSISLSTSNKFFFSRWYGNLKIESTHTFASYKDSAETKTNTREIFVDTALWMPFVKTSNKEINIEFTMPDNLTTWRINSFGISKEKLDFKTKEIVSNLDFYARPLLPNFLRIGDNVEFQVVIYNNTDEYKEIPYYIDFDSQYISIDKSDGKVYMEPYSNEIVLFDLTAKEIGNSDILFDFEKDIVRLPFEVKTTTIENEIIELFNTNIKPLIIEKGVEYRPYSMDLVINEVIDYLYRYPYYCSEQTISKIYPLVIASNKGYDIEDIDKLVINGIQRLMSYQNFSGGWGWWRFDDSAIHLTSYVLEGLYHLRENGYFVPSNNIYNALQFLQNRELTGYSYYVLRLFGRDNIEFSPVNDVDILYKAFFDDDYYNKVFDFVVSDGEFSKIEFFDSRYFFTNVDYNYLFLKLLLEKEPNNEHVMKVFKYLLANRYGSRWFSTKESARMLELMLNFRDYISFENDIEYHDFIVSNEVVTIDNKGLYEIRYIEEVEPNTNNNIEVNKNFYRRDEIEVFDNKNNIKSVVDGFFSVDDSFNIEKYVYETLENEYIEFNDEVIWLDRGQYFYTIYDTEYLNIYKDYDLFVNGIKFGFINKFIISNNYIFLSSYNKLFVYDYIYDAIVKEYEFDRIIDFVINNNRPIILHNTSNKKYLFFSEFEYYELDKDFIGLDYFNDEIYLFSNSTYKFNKHNNTYERLLPLSGNKILSLNDNKITLFGFIYFEGNRKNSNQELSINHIYYNNDYIYENNLGDILKVIVDFNSKVNNYFIIEDFLPGNIQVLENYLERDIASESKFYSYWYTPWDFWYSGKEVRLDRIAFFSNNRNVGSFEYYIRLTHTGDVYYMPALGYNMYWRANYGTSDYNILNIIK